MTLGRYLWPWLEWLAPNHLNLRALSTDDSAQQSTSQAGHWAIACIRSSVNPPSALAKRLAATTERVGSDDELQNDAGVGRRCDAGEGGDDSQL